MKLQAYDSRSTPFMELTTSAQKEFVKALRRQREELAREKQRKPVKRKAKSPNPISLNRKDPERRAILRMLKQS